MAETETKPRSTSRRYGEAHAKDGTLIRFTHPGDLSDDEVAQVKATITQLGDITFPSSHRVNVSHACYGRYSRYTIIQHFYAGGPGGYVEILDIADAPADRQRTVIYNYGSSGDSRFWEFESIEQAQAAFDSWRSGKLKEHLPKQSGFVREVFCDAMPPWFYAVGDQELIGDWAFPNGVQQHPYFVCGELYTVRDGSGSHTAFKRCLGSKIDRDYPGKYQDGDPLVAIVVFWDDGTVFRARVDRLGNRTSNGVVLPQRVTESAEKSAEALGAFRRLLAYNPDTARELLAELEGRHYGQPTAEGFK